MWDLVWADPLQELGDDKKPIQMTQAVCFFKKPSLFFTFIFVVVVINSNGKE